MEYKIPKYLHRPYQILFLDAEDVGVLLLVYAVNMLFDLGKWGWIGGIAFVYLMFRLKRNGPRGYIKHLLYYFGFYKFKRAPGRFETKFYE